MRIGLPILHTPRSSLNNGERSTTPSDPKNRWAAEHRPNMQCTYRATPYRIEMNSLFEVLLKRGYGHFTSSFMTTLISNSPQVNVIPEQDFSGSLHHLLVVRFKLERMERKKAARHSLTTFSDCLLVNFWPAVSKRCFAACTKICNAFALFVPDCNFAHSRKQ